jgi:hypothetical protein
MAERRARIIGCKKNHHQTPSRTHLAPELAPRVAHDPVLGVGGGVNTPSSDRHDVVHLCVTRVRARHGKIMKVGIDRQTMDANRTKDNQRTDCAKSRKTFGYAKHTPSERISSIVCVMITNDSERHFAKRVLYLRAAGRVDNAAIVVAQRVGVHHARDRTAREDLGHDGGLALRCRCKERERDEYRGTKSKAESVRVRER